MKRIAILGSTGSVGKQTLQVIAANPDKFCVSALTAYSNKKTLLEQKVAFFSPFVGLVDTSAILDDGVVYGKECLINAIEDADVVVVAMRGIVALPAVLCALQSGKTVALANKEILVCAGKLVLDALNTSTGKIIPVDSEHSAVFQCLGNGKQIKNIILTASGGPFFGRDRQFLQTVTKEQTLNHPRWNMGKKITVDSATLINKGFEVIEAHWLFGLDLKDIEVVVHPQCAVHSLVCFDDGAVLAQLAVPDMKLPISFALGYPERIKNAVKPLELKKLKNLEFFPVENDIFLGINICRQAFEQHLLMPTVLNSADEVAVDAFLQGKIGFLQIYDVIKYVCNYYKNRLNGINFGVNEIEQLDEDVKIFSRSAIEGGICC